MERKRSFFASSDDEEEHDFIVINDDASNNCDTRTTKRRRKNNKFRKEGTEPEEASMRNADLVDVENREMMRSKVDGLLDDVPKSNTIENGFPEHFQRLQRNSARILEKEEAASKAVPQNVQLMQISQQNKLLITSLLCGTGSMVDIVAALRTVVAQGVPSNDFMISLENALSYISFVTYHTLEANLVEAHGKWPACSRYSPDVKRQSPHAWNRGFCGMTVCPNLEPFRIRAFFPGESDENVLNGKISNDAPPLCVFCQLADSDHYVHSIQEHLITVPNRFVAQKFYVATRTQDGFAPHMCNIPSDISYHGIVLPIPRFFAQLFEMGTEIPHPDGGDTGLKTVRMLYKKMADLAGSAQRFG